MKHCPPTSPLPPPPRHTPSPEAPVYRLQEPFVSIRVYRLIRVVPIRVYRLLGVVRVLSCLNVATSFRVFSCLNVS